MAATKGEGNKNGFHVPQALLLMGRKGREKESPTRLLLQRNCFQKFWLGICNCVVMARRERAGNNWQCAVLKGALPRYLVTAPACQQNGNCLQFFGFVLSQKGINIATEAPPPSSKKNKKKTLRQMMSCYLYFRPNYLVAEYVGRRILCTGRI